MTCSQLDQVEAMTTHDRGEAEVEQSKPETTVEWPEGSSTAWS